MISDSLIVGEDVAITDFASFRIKDRPAKRYRNSTTGKMIEIRPGKRVKVKMSEKVMKAIDPESNVEN